MSRTLTEPITIAGMVPELHRDVDPGERSAGAPGDPDVTVVVAVYNTLPYLEVCLDSLVAQTLHRDRPGSVEVITVDDGSTDGSGAVLDTYAARHPELFTVVHQANSGGPAQPSNLALDRARGRWVYFVGADDRLGAEALERLVAHGDRVAADVVIGAQVGVGRFVPNAFVGKDRDEIDPYGQHLRWTLANSKLFRRAHIERLGLRYREDMRIGSDQPFTLQACLAGRVAVLGSYDCYFVVRRHDDSNITYGVDLARRAADTERLIEAVAELVPDEHRAHFLVRHFTWEINRLLPGNLDALAPPERDLLLTAVRRIADRWYTPELHQKLGVVPRVRLRLALAGEVDALGSLREAVDLDDGFPVLLRNGRALSALPVLDTPASARAGLTDGDYALGPRAVARRVRGGIEVGAPRWERDRLTVDLALPLDPASTELPSVWVGAADEPDPGVDGSLVRDGSRYRLDLRAPAGTDLASRLGGRARVFVGGRVVARDGHHRCWAVAITALDRPGGGRGMLARLRRRMAGVRDGR